MRNVFRRRHVLKISAGALTAAVSVYMLLGTAWSYRPDTSQTKEPLLKTSWQQMGGFEKFTPNRERTGCWSTALAQVVFHHKLSPHGKVDYVTSGGATVNEDLAAYRFNLDEFESRIDSDTPQTIADEMARYNYLAATVMMKDFGTGSYMHKLAPVSLVSDHFSAQASRYVSAYGRFPCTSRKIESVIAREVMAERPVLLHFANLDDFGHSVVVDGCRYDDDGFVVHINNGQGGEGDGWYPWSKGILREDDGKLRVVYTVRPS